jgi:predicted nucleotidyltransferase
MVVNSERGHADLPSQGKVPAVAQDWSVSVLVVVCLTPRLTHRRVTVRFEEEIKKMFGQKKELLRNLTQRGQRFETWNVDINQSEDGKCPKEGDYIAELSA